MRIKGSVLRFTCWMLAVFLTIGDVYSMDLLSAAPGTMLLPSQKYCPVSVKGIKIDQQDPFKIDFIVDTGDCGRDIAVIKEKSHKLISYFMASLAVPLDDVWVNLSPYESDRIIPENLSVTELGRDMLAQDYLLKQLSASLTHPDSDIGKKYWNSSSEQGDITKIWIIPEKAEVVFSNNTAFIAQSRLGLDAARDSSLKTLLSEIEKEINEGKNFSEMRQMYNCMILAMWFKKNVHNILNKNYADSSKVAGIDFVDKNVKQEIFARYVEAFNMGAYNINRKEKTGRRIAKRNYFSGGVIGAPLAAEYDQNSISASALRAVAQENKTGEYFTVSSSLSARNKSAGEHHLADMDSSSSIGPGEELYISDFSKDHVVIDTSEFVEQGETVSLSEILTGFSRAYPQKIADPDSVQAVVFASGIRLRTGTAWFDPQRKYIRSGQYLWVAAIDSNNTLELKPDAVFFLSKFDFFDDKQLLLWEDDLLSVSDKLSGALDENAAAMLSIGDLCRKADENKVKLAGILTYVVTKILENGGDIYYNDRIYTAYTALMKNLLSDENVYKSVFNYVAQQYNSKDYFSHKSNELSGHGFRLDYDILVPVLMAQEKDNLDELVVSSLYRINEPDRNLVKSYLAQTARTLKSRAIHNALEIIDLGSRKYFSLDLSETDTAMDFLLKEVVPFAFITASEHVFRAGLDESYEPKMLYTRAYSFLLHMMGNDISRAVRFVMEYGNTTLAERFLFFTLLHQRFPSAQEYRLNEESMMSIVDLAMRIMGNPDLNIKQLCGYLSYFFDSYGDEAKDKDFAQYREKLIPELKNLRERVKENSEAVEAINMLLSENVSGSAILNSEFGGVRMKGLDMTMHQDGTSVIARQEKTIVNDDEIIGYTFKINNVDLTDWDAVLGL